jgi:hypothetical protein
MSAVIPILGSEGWVTDPQHKLTCMLAHALVSDYSQTTIYAGKVTSLAYIIATHQTDQTEMADVMESTLREYYSRVFLVSDISVMYSDVIDQKYKLYISVSVIANGETYSLSVACDVDNGTLSHVLKIVNDTGGKNL